MPNNRTYSGPTPSGGIVKGAVAFPALPQLPAPKVFPNAGNGKIKSSQTIGPGQYGKIELDGNDVLTFDGPGVYVFESINNKGNTNYFKYDFKGTTSGLIEIYVHNEIDLHKNRAIFLGGNAARIFVETHEGQGSKNSKTAFELNESSGGLTGSVQFAGIIYAPYGDIEIAAGSGNDKFEGAVWASGNIKIKKNSELKLAVQNTNCNCIIPIPS